MPRTIQLLLAALLFLCLLDMPYGYYQLVRFLSAGVFAVMAYQAGQSENMPRMAACIALALLFQPFFKVHLGRTLWNVVDVAVGIWLVYDALHPQQKR